MASGCVAAGFTGIGAREVAEPTNSFWVEEDDCEAAADLVAGGGAPLALCRTYAREAATRYSHAGFRRALNDAWTELAPEARRGGPRRGGQPGPHRG